MYIIYRWYGTCHLDLVQMLHYFVAFFFDAISSVCKISLILICYAINYDQNHRNLLHLMESGRICLCLYSNFELFSLLLFFIFCVCAKMSVSFTFDYIKWVHKSLNITVVNDLLLTIYSKTWCCQWSNTKWSFKIKDLDTLMHTFFRLNRQIS